MSQELSILIPEKTVNLRERKIKVLPFKFKDFSLVIEIIEKNFKTFQDAIEKAQQQENFEKDTMVDGVAGILFDRIQESYEIVKDVSELIQITTVLSFEEIENLYHDEVLLLISVIFAQNRDFFAQLMEKVAPEKEPKEQRIPSKQATIGESKLAA